MRRCGLAALLLPLAQLSEAAAPPVTFHKHIAPILFEYCAPCHRLGESGPFPLLTYQDARKHAAQIATVTPRRYMPPWLPEPGHGDFANERRLSDAQIQLIHTWAATGAPEGAVSDSPRPPTFTPGWQLGPPDLIVKLARPFPVPADGRDVFWNFLLSPAVLERRYVKAIEIRPGVARSVHHANLLLDRARSSRRQEKTPGEGFPGMDLTLETETFDPDSHFLFWKPGGAPRIEPDGMAWRLDPGNDLVLNVHFHPTGKPELVQPSIGLYFTDKPPAKFPMLVQIEHDRALDIAPGTRDFVVSDDFQLPLDVDVIAVYPHAHYLGTVLEGYATLPDGSRRWLIRIPRWDLNWQAVYRYRQPLFLPKGAVISMRFHYDNSAGNPRNPNAPPKWVVSGDQSADEMGHLWLQVLPRGGDQRAALQEALMRHRLENDPANFSAHFNLGVLLLARKDSSSAITHLRESLRLFPRQPLATNDLGAALQLEGKLEDALEQFLYALQLQPDYANARFNLASVLAAQGNLDEAAANYRQVLSNVPEDRAAEEQLVAVLIKIGNAAATEGRLSAAAASYRELVTLRPGDADLRNNLGILLARSGDLKSAAEQFEAALRANPSHQTARRNLDLIRGKRAQH
jgi:Flp pilus assembly protein TadD/mono/diheme cytochrome c family protein